MATRPRLARRGVVPAFVVTGVVFGAVLIEQVLSGVLTVVRAAEIGVPTPDVLGASASATLASAGTSTLPLAIGVFVSLWQIAPIGAELRVGHVLSRSALAAGVGAVLALVVSSIAGIISDFVTARGSLFDGGLYSVAEQVPYTLGSALVSATSTFVTALPLVALAALVLWIRLQDKDRGYRVEGMLDL